MWVAVLGAGDLGLACAAALRANGAGHVTLLSREGTLQTSQEKLLRKVSSATEDGSLTSLSSRMGGITLQPLMGGKPEPLDLRDGVFFCTPATALLSRDDFPRSPQNSDNSSRDTSQASSGEKLTHTDEKSTTGRHPLFSHGCSFSDCSSGTNGHPFAACFTRGFGPDGETGAELARDTLRTAQGLKRPLPVYTVCGPILPKEWLHQCTLVAPEEKKDGAASALPHALSATALTLALTTVAAGAGEEVEHLNAFARDSGFHDAMEQLFKQQLLQRESVVYDRDPTAGEVLSLVNGCLPLCAFGAGLVSNAYTGAGVSALAAYAQHCASATTALVNNLVEGRAAGTPLPMGAYVAIFSACTVFSSKEFVLGRQMDFRFRQLDAVRAVYPGHAHEAFSATVDGLHTRMQARQVASPFYETLMDAFGTVIRASTAGLALVKEGGCDWSEAPPSAVLQHVMRVDEAMLSGDEARFEQAKKDFAEAFPMYPAQH